MINIARPCRLFVAVVFLFLASSCKQQHSPYQKVVLKDYITDSVPFSANGFFLRFKEKRNDLKFLGVGIIDSVKVTTVRLQDSSVIASLTNKEAALKNAFKVAIIYGPSNKWICFDTDNDGNLEEEQLHRLDTFKNAVVVRNVGLYDGRIYRTLDVVAKYDAITPFGVEGVSIHPYYRIGNFSVDSIEFRFALEASSFAPEYNKKSASLVISEASQPFKSPKERPIKYNVGDTIYFKSKSFRFAEVSKGGDTLSLEELADNIQHYGIEPGQYAFPMQAAEISNGNTFTIGKNRKYTLIDFWGTWCGPCKKIMPDLKALYRQAAEKNFDIVSVAFDGSLSDVADYVRDENIQWINLFDDRNNSVICKKFKVEAFPTLMLLDENGKIVFREIGDEKGIEMARSALLK